MPIQHRTRVGGEGEWILTINSLGAFASIEPSPRGANDPCPLCQNWRLFQMCTTCRRLNSMHFQSDDETIIRRHDLLEGREMGDGGRGVNGLHRSQPR